MNDREKVDVGRKRRISRKTKVVVAVALTFAAGILFLAFSLPAMGVLRSGGALAMRSFHEMLAPEASAPIILDAPLPLRNVSPILADPSPGVPSRTSSKIPRSASRAPSTTVKKEAAVPISGGSSSSQKTTGSVSSSLSAATASSGREAIEPDFLEFDLSTSSSPAETAAPIPAAVSSSPRECSFADVSAAGARHHVVLNEIAWMGLPAETGETAEHAAGREWIELKNISSEPVSLEGWRIIDAADKMSIVFGSGDTIPAHGFYLLLRNGVAVRGIAADKAYTGALPNTGDGLAVLDASCETEDVVNATSSWPGGSNSTKQTMERRSDLGWQTSLLPGGTPRAENSPGVAVSSATTGTLPIYRVDLMVIGPSGGKVTVRPSGTICTSSVALFYPLGTKISLSAMPGKGMNFSGWSGACSGTGSCSFMVGGTMSVTAGFNSSYRESLPEYSALATDTPTVATDTTSTTGVATTTVSTSTAGEAIPADHSPPQTLASTLSGVDHLIIAAIQIAGTASTDDLVKIYNPLPDAVDIGGWKLRKKTGTGSDASIREFPKGSVVASGSYFVWASSVNGFAESIGADTSSTATFAENNSVALFDATGTQIDAVAWGTGENQYVEGSPYPNGPPAGQELVRRSAGGALVDTDNNADDFTVLTTSSL
jgi:hypothetical protein